MLIFKTDKETFVAAVQKELAVRGIGLTYDPEQFCLRGEGIYTTFLANAYSEFAAQPLLRRHSYVQEYVRRMDKPQQYKTPSGGDIREKLMPHVRRRISWEKDKEKVLKLGQNKPFQSRTIFGGGHLIIDLAIDEGNTIGHLPQTPTEEFGLTDAEAFEIASANIRRLPGGFRMMHPGVYLSQWRDCYDATRMLYSDLFADLELRGRPVAMIPNRDYLLLTGDQDELGLQMLAAGALEALKLPRPMSRLAFRLDAGWVPFLPEPGHPAYKALKELEIEEMAVLYDEQRDQLIEQYQKEGASIGVSRYGSTRNSSGTPFSGTELTENLEALLPKADFISFHLADAGASPGQKVGFGPWDTTMDLLRDAVEPAGLYPERYRVSRFPTREEMAQINSAAVLRAA